MIASPAAAMDRAEAEQAVKGAMERHHAGDFAGAAQLYQKVIDGGFASADLYFNLGNAQQRAGRIGWAIHAYASALALSPGDEDARANLEMAQKVVVDRVVGGEAPFLERVLSRVSGRTVTWAFVICWLLLWGALAWRRVAPDRARTAWAAATVLAAILSITFGGLVAGKAWDGRAPTAVVVVPNTKVREGPSPGLRSPFELHEGTQVRLVESEGDFVRIRLPNGLEGWVGHGDVAQL
jgi:hypothetical protein